MLEYNLKSAEDELGLRFCSLPHYAVCINNEGYNASFEIGKLYCVIPDEQAASHGYIRVIDESGEDYGYSAKRFFPIKIPRELEKLFLTASIRRSICRRIN